MKRRDNSHGDPEPRIPPQFPLKDDGETEYANAIQNWRGKIESSKLNKRPNDERTDSHPTQHDPPRQPYFLSGLNVVIGISYC